MSWSSCSAQLAAIGLLVTVAGSSRDTRSFTSGFPPPPIPPVVPATVVPATVPGDTVVVKMWTRSGVGVRRRSGTARDPRSHCCALLVARAPVRTSMHASHTVRMSPLPPPLPPPRPPPRPPPLPPPATAEAKRVSAPPIILTGLQRCLFSSNTIMRSRRRSILPVRDNTSKRPRRRRR